MWRKNHTRVARTVRVPLCVCGRHMCHHMAHLHAAPATTSRRVGEEGRRVAAANDLVGQATQHPLGVVEQCICICVSVSECARLSLSACVHE